MEDDCLVKHLSTFEAILWDSQKDQIYVGNTKNGLPNDLYPTLLEALHKHSKTGNPSRQLADNLYLFTKNAADAQKSWNWVLVEKSEKTPLKKEKQEGCCHHHEHSSWRFLLGLSATCGLLGILAFFCSHFSNFPGWVPVVLYLGALLAGSWDALGDLREKLPKGQLDIHFLMVAVAVGAASIGAFGEATLLLFLFSLSGGLELLAENKTRRAIDSLLRAAPNTGTLASSSDELFCIPTSLIQPGMRLLVRPGELFPVDGTVLSGDTAADESNITGESVPIDKKQADPIYSGTLNLWGAVFIQAERKAKESSLQKIIRLIQEAQHLKAPSQRFTERFGTPYTYLVLILITGMFCLWHFAFDIPAFTTTPGVYSAFYRAMALLVVMSPCALVISIPSAILAAIAWGAGNGVLFRGGAAIEKLSTIDCIACDKTGTVTTGELHIVSTECLHGELTANDILQIAYSIERHSKHPLAQAINNHAKKHNTQPLPIDNFRSLTGIGVEAEVQGIGLCRIGKYALLETTPWAKELEQASKPDKAHTEIWLICPNALGRIWLKDTLRPEAKTVFAYFRKLGIPGIMLTGDRRPVAEDMGKELGIIEIYPELQPADKVAHLKRFTNLGKKVAMIGDGVNDAPSLAAAYVSIAMGARGSDAALEQSEVVLMEDRLDKLLAAYHLSRRARRVIKTNLILSLGAIGVMVVAGSCGIVPLTLGVIVHEGSTLIVCLNSLRLLRKKAY